MTEYHNQPADQTLTAALDLAERLKAERDEALCRLLSAGSEKPTAEDMDWAISLSASLRREEIAVEETEITRLTSQLDLYKAALERIVNLDETVSDVCDHLQEIARDALSQWIKDRQAKTDGEAS